MSFLGGMWFCCYEPHSLLETHKLLPKTFFLKHWLKWKSEYCLSQCYGVVAMQVILYCELIVAKKLGLQVSFVFVIVVFFKFFFPWCHFIPCMIFYAGFVHYHSLSFLVSMVTFSTDFLLIGMTFATLHARIFSRCLGSMIHKILREGLMILIR